MRTAEESFSSAKDFMDALRWTDARWAKDAGRWVFRGHADASWQLVPSLFRLPVQGQLASWTRLVTSIAATQPLRVDLPGDLRARFVEAAARLGLQTILVADFASLADSLRFPLPVEVGTIDPGFDFSDLTPLINSMLNWQWSEPLSAPSGLDALAQHHGIPTGMLDWTGNPLVAGFFAAYEAARNAVTNDGVNTLAVWALHPATKLLEDSRIQFFRAEMRFNQYMHAQSGLFTWDTLSCRDFIRSGRWPCQAEVLRGSPLYGMFDEPPLCKLTLPISEAQELLRLLRVEGLSRAHLFPTLDNVAKTVLDNPRGPLRRA